MGHENKCAHLHGHNYVLFVTVSAADLDTVGRVIDFSVLKDKLGGWIDHHWDHGMILWEREIELIPMFQGLKQKFFILPRNPTAENMAHYLLEEVCPPLFAGTGVQIDKITIWETENCYAEAIRN